MTITNVADTSAWVNWVTSVQSPAGSNRIAYGTNQASLGFSALESPDFLNQYVHTAKLSSLVASTTYYFAVSVPGASDNTTYQFTTGPPIASTSSPCPAGVPPVAMCSASGVVYLPDGRAAAGVLVTVTIQDNAGLNGTQPTTSGLISTLTDAQGNWSLPLSPRTHDNSALFRFATNRNPPDYLGVDVDGGSLGQAATGWTFPINLNGSSALNVGSISMLAVTPTSTPTGASATATPSATATLTLTPPATPTSANATSTPTVSTSPSPAPTTPRTLTWTPIPAAPTEPAISTAIPASAPPVVPAQPPLSSIAPPAGAVPAPTAPSVAAPAPLVEIPTDAPEIAPTLAPTDSIPTVSAPATPAALFQVLTPQATPPSTPTLMATAADLVVTPAALPSTPEPLGRALASTVGGLGLGGLGLTLIVLGLVKQRAN